MQASCGKDNLRKFYWDSDGKKYSTELGVPYLFTENKDDSYQITWTTSETAGRQQNMSHVEMFLKLVDLGEPTSFLDHVYLGCTQRDCKPNQKL